MKKLEIQPLLYVESKKVVQILFQNKTISELEFLIIEKNLFQLRTLNKRKSLFSELLTRFQGVDSYLLEQFLETDGETAKGILGYTMIKNNQFLYESLRTLYFEKILFLEEKITVVQAKNYFIGRVGVRGTRMFNSYVHFAKEIGFIEENGTDLYLKKIIIDPAVAIYLINYCQPAVTEILLGEIR